MSDERALQLRFRFSSHFANLRPVFDEVPPTLAARGFLHKVKDASDLYIYSIACTCCIDAGRLLLRL